ncbi:MAG TPA: hypothetical protein VHF69_09155, partial [Candidatus Synoicihabitans sp.]|nr:hypothetical protein [Candidatus Synoicihabitans sp.]
MLLWIEGSPDEDTIWRGWPAVVRVQTLSGDPPPDVQLRGPSSVALKRAGKVWFIPATVTAEMAPGSYTLTTGEQQVDIAVGEAPAHLTAVQQSIRARLLVQSAVASGDTAAAQRAADAWVQAAPNSFEAREAQGDMRRARGDSAGALDAYNAAVQRVPRGIDPPPAGLHGKVGALLRERAAALPSRPAAAPSRDEVKYYELIDAGDQALATGDPAAASHSFAEADAWHRERSLTVSSAELDEKRAALGPPSAASVSTPPQAQSTTASAPLSAAASQPVRPAASAIAPTSAPAGLAPGKIIPA